MAALVGSLLDRSRFPALHQEVNGRSLVYLDNAATVHKPQEVIDVESAFYAKDNSNVRRGVHELSARATAAFEASRETLRATINAADVREIVFTKGCTEAINLVAWSWGLDHLRPHDTILVSNAEHHANLVPWQIVAEKVGARVEAIPISDDGALDLRWLDGRLQRRDVRVVAVKHVCNALGVVHPVHQIVEMARRDGAISVVDGAQALAHAEVDVQELGVDFYAMSAHKTYGPTGVGALYGRLDLLEAMSPYQAGGDMIRTVSFEGTTFAEPPTKFEAGTPNIAGVIGFGAALEMLRNTGVREIAQHEEHLADLARERLSELPGVRTVGDAPQMAGIVSFVVDGVHPHDLGTILDQHGVAIRAGHHCCMPLMIRLNLPATVRASFASYNDTGDVDRLVEGVAAAQRLFA